MDSVFFSPPFSFFSMLVLWWLELFSFKEEGTRRGVASEGFPLLFFFPFFSSSPFLVRGRDHSARRPIRSTGSTVESRVAGLGPFLLFFFRLIVWCSSFSKRQR